VTDSIHYKYAEYEDETTPLCELPIDYFPSKYSSKQNKLKPLPEDASFGEGFCSDCNDRLEELELIEG